MNHIINISNEETVGTITFYQWSTPPPDWIICDWREVSRIDYSSLFSLIGTKYWVGDWLTTFNIPDLRYKTPID